MSFVERSAVEKRDDPEIAAECLEPNPRLETEFGEAASADGIAVRIARADLLVAIATHRPAAARIEAP